MAQQLCDGSVVLEGPSVALPPRSGRAFRSSHARHRTPLRDWAFGEDDATLHGGATAIRSASPISGNTPRRRKVFSLAIAGGRSATRSGVASPRSGFCVCLCCGGGGDDCNSFSCVCRSVDRALFRSVVGYLCLVIVIGHPLCIYLVIALALRRDLLHASVCVYSNCLSLVLSLSLSQAYGSPSGRSRHALLPRRRWVTTLLHLARASGCGRASGPEAASS